MCDGEERAVAIRRVVVAPRDVVYLKGILEASEGLGLLLADQGGELALLTTGSQLAQLESLIDDLASEIPLRRRGGHARPTPPRAAEEANLG